MATTRSLLGLDGKQRGLPAISGTASHVLHYIPEEEQMQSHILQVNAYLFVISDALCVLAVCVSACVCT